MINASGRPIVLVIDDPSMIGEARRTATAMAGRLGFDETERGKVAIVATEAATNLSKHARGGELVIQGIECGSIGGVDILSLDQGPGIPDVDRCMIDGFSTAGSPGTGLGAMARLSDFSLTFTPFLSDNGTATCLARLWSAFLPPSLPQGFGFGVRERQHPLCRRGSLRRRLGDRGGRWANPPPRGRRVRDTGPQAAEAARAALKVFEEKSSLGPGDVIQATHAALRTTRGAALAVARIDPKRGEVRFAGVGNISGSIHGPADARSLSMVSHNGIVGHTIRKIQEFSYPWVPGSLLVMHSDGLATQWQLSRYSGLCIETSWAYRWHALSRLQEGPRRRHRLGRSGRGREPSMSLPILTLEVRLEPDVVLARQRARQIAGLVGFGPLDQTRIATAVSEIARNAFQYAGGGRVEFQVNPGPTPGLLIRVHERGPGIKDLQAILDGRYDSPTGLGVGILGAKRLMDQFEIQSSESGSIVTMIKIVAGENDFILHAGSGTRLR